MILVHRIRASTRRCCVFSIEDRSLERHLTTLRSLFSVASSIKEPLHYVAHFFPLSKEAIYDYQTKKQLPGFVRGQLLYSMIYFRSFSNSVKSVKTIFDACSSCSNAFSTPMLSPELWQSTANFA